MAHKVKCFFCGVTFDRDKEPFVQIGTRRYAHMSCSNKDGAKEKIHEQDDRDKFY